jgi:23S rRNA (pseudouridine1915-N3)-methyltransferase
VILRLCHAGKAAGGPLGMAADEYRQRVSRYTRVEELFVAPAKLRRDSPADRRRALDEEAARLAAQVGPRDRLVALLPGQAGWSSEGLAERLEAWLGAGSPAVCVALGGPIGLGHELLEAAAERWSFGPLTLPHDLARVVCWEQLYRAFTILRGEPYHK